MIITHDNIYEALTAKGGFSGGCIDVAAVADVLGVNLTSWELPEAITSKISVIVTLLVKSAQNPLLELSQQFVIPMQVAKYLYGQR